jgi:hypothetical protein
MIIFEINIFHYGAKHCSFFTKLLTQEVGVVVLWHYKQFLIFSLFHTVYIQRNEKLLLERLKVTSHVILSEYKKSELD